MHIILRYFFTLICLWLVYFFFSLILFFWVLRSIVCCWFFPCISLSSMLSCLCYCIFYFFFFCVSLFFWFFVFLFYSFCAKRQNLRETQYRKMTPLPMIIRYLTLRDRHITRDKTKFIDWYLKLLKSCVLIYICST